MNATWMREEKRIQEDVPLATLDEVMQALEKKIVVDDAAWVPLLGSTHLFAIGDRVESFIPYWAGFSNFYVNDVTLK